MLIQYHKRKHECFESTGIPLGKAYCDDMMTFSSGFTKNDLFNCYEKHGVEYIREFCNNLFPIDGTGDDGEDNTNEYLYCISDYGIQRGQDFCDLTYPTENPDDIDYDVIKDKIDCYDLYLVDNNIVCDTKYLYYSSLDTSDAWTGDDLWECYTNSGYTLDQDFCDNNYEGVEAQYKCYETIDLGISLDR